MIKSNKSYMALLSYSF